MKSSLHREIQEIMNTKAKYEIEIQEKMNTKGVLLLKPEKHSLISEETLFKHWQTDLLSPKMKEKSSPFLQKSPEKVTSLS